MKIVVASDSFKGCMTSKQVSDIMEESILKASSSCSVKKFLVGDGGEGTMAAIHAVCGGEYTYRFVRDIYGKKIEVPYLVLEDGTAFIEVSKVIGLNLYPREKRNALYTSSYGVGQLVHDAYVKGCKKIVVLLGGTGCNDGGMGFLEALGVKFYDENHHRIHGMTKNLEKIDFIDIRKMHRMKDVSFVAAYDVNNTLLGEEGATILYGKQKGLYPNQIKRVEAAMSHYVKKMERLHFYLDKKPGGAAGGIAAVLCGVYHAKPVSGLDLLFSYNHIEEAIKECDLVFTGEGQSDYQTKYGKVPYGINEIAKKYNKPCIIISGALGKEYETLYEEGFIGIYSIADHTMTFKQAIEQAPDKLEKCTYSVMKTILYYRGEKE